VHPVHVESVAWVTERKNVLSGLFYLAALLAYLESGFGFRGSGVGDDKADALPALPETRHPKPDARYFLSLALFVLALWSKTVTCSLPAAILLVLWWKRGLVTWADVKPLIPFFVLGAASAMYTGHLERAHVGASGAEFDFSPIDRVLIAGRAVWFYVWKLILPLNLSFIYPRWEIDPSKRWLFAFPIAAVLLVVAQFMLRRRIGRGPLVALLFFGGTVLPALGFVNVYPMRYSFVADHFQYLASIGVIVLLVALLRRVVEKTTPYMPVVLIPLGLMTFTQARIYKNTETLWHDTAAKNPNSWMVHTNLGHALVERAESASGDERQALLDAAQAQYERSLELAPQLPEPHWNVGIGQSVRGNLDGALREFDEAVRLEPNFPQGYYSRGNVYRERGQLDEAIAQYEKAIALKKDYAEAYYNLGVIAEKQDRIDDAIKAYRLATTNRLEYEAAHYSLANLLFKQGRYDEAAVHYSQVVRINPRRAEAHVNFGATFLKLGRFNDAAKAFRAALAIDPTLVTAQKGLQAAIANGAR
jgi:Flp pilus assembly protein TadD